MRVFKTRSVARFARKSRLDDKLLVEAIDRAAKGLIDADLGGGLIKQRVGRPGQGRSGGYRTIIAARWGNKAFFIYAFAKNERDNISPIVLSELKEIARVLLAAGDEELKTALEDGEIEEIDYGES